MPQASKKSTPSETRHASEELPLEERVQRRAYELYALRGNESGSELDDWLQAEEEIRAAEEGKLKLRTSGAAG